MSRRLFDTFLSDTTRFIFLNHPTALGANCSVNLEDVLASESLPEMITDLVNKKVREISYSSFLSRIDFLKNRFGLDLTLDEKVLDQLEHYSSVRNIAIHDQGFLDVFLVEKDKLGLKNRACPHHPTPVSLNDIRGASSAYDRAAEAISVAVLRQVLKVDQDSWPMELLELIQKGAETADTPLVLDTDEDE